MHKPWQWVVVVVALSFAIGRASNSQPRSVATAIHVPAGFHRMEYSESTFAGWIQRLPLKSDTLIHEFNGTIARDPRFNVLAVIEMLLLFQPDLEQRADFCMRMRTQFYENTSKWY